MRLRLCEANAAKHKNLNTERAIAHANLVSYMDLDCDAIGLFTKWIDITKHHQFVGWALP
jgi:hypothetical protein